MIQGQRGNQFVRAPLVEHLDACEGKTLGELDVSNVFRKTIAHPKVTGIAGDVVEQSILYLSQNSKQEPDIVVDNVKYEVKTTGIRKSKKRGDVPEAKEPMSITAVSPNAIVDEDFSESSFWHKITHMLIFFYLYDSHSTVVASDYARFPLLSYEFHEFEDFTEEERRTLERDWTKVRNFITRLQESYTDYEAEYPRISHDLRRELMLLDTAPKWPNPPRFRFKRTFVSCIYRDHLDRRRKKKLEVLPEKYVEVRDIENKCGELTSLYRGKTVGWLRRHFGLEVASDFKAIAEPVIVKMFGGTKKKMRDIELFAKIGLLGKSIVLTKRGARTEDTKFFTIDFDEFNDSELAFEDSQFYEFFSTCRILFIVFEEPNQEAPLTENRFVGFKMVTFDEGFIQQHVRPVWERIRHLIREKLLKDVIERDKHGCPRINPNGEVRSAPNFPKSSEGLVFVRGTSSDSHKKPELVNGIRMYHQQVWLKGSYLASMLEDVLLIT